MDNTPDRLGDFVQQRSEIIKIRDYKQATLIKALTS